MQLGDVYLSDEDALSVSRAAIAAATARGYCAETRNVLSDLGLPMPVEKRKVVIEVVVDISERPETDLTETYYFNLTHDLVNIERGDFTVLSVEDAE